MNGQLAPTHVFTGPTFTPNKEWLVDDNHCEFKSVEIDPADITDSGSPISGVIREGRVLGKITTGGKYTDYDNGAANGSEAAAAVLYDTLDLRDPVNPGSRVAGPVFARVIIRRGRVRYANLLGIDANGKTDLIALGFIFEADL